MSTSELERLLWERIDGTLEAADAERLRQLLADGPEAERLEAEIALLAKELDGIEELSAPADLGDDIRRALRAAGGPAAAAESAAGSRRASLSWLVGPRPTRRLVYLAAAAVFAVVGYTLVTSPAGRDGGPFTGTVGLTGPDSSTPAVRLELPDASGALSIFERAGGLAVELETSPALGPVRLSILGAGLELERAGQRGGASFEVVSSEGGPALDVSGAGVVELAVAASGPARRITVRVEAGAEILLAHELELE